MYNTIAQLLQQKKFQEAYQLLSKEEARVFRNSQQGLNLLGVCERALGRPQNAVRAYLASLRSDPKQSGVWTNLGNAYKDMNKLSASMQCHSIANEMTHNQDAQVLHNMGITAALSNHHELAIELFQKALISDPTKSEIKWDLARSQLAIFDYKNGWLNYKQRWECRDVGVKRFDINEWNGQSLKGKTILVYLEQGFGDYIQCVRFVRNLIQFRPAHVFLEVKKELKSLIAETFKNADFISMIDYVDGYAPPTHDYNVSIVDLPNFFAKDYRKFKSDFPYLSTPQFHDEIKIPEGQSKKIKVGIVWSGSVTFKRNNFRAADLAYFSSNFALPNVQLYSLQMGVKRNELEKYPNQIIPLDGLINDFSDTSKILDQLDLIISTCTSMVHLCGALNKKCWVLLDYSPHWLWGTHEETTNWYPSLRLFRQKIPGGWTEVFDIVQSELLKETNKLGLLA